MVFIYIKKIAVTILLILAIFFFFFNFFRLTLVDNIISHEMLRKPG